MPDETTSKELGEFGYIVTELEPESKTVRYIGFDWHHISKIANVKLFVEDRSFLGKYSPTTTETS